jgi:hypothetical protein
MGVLILKGSAKKAMFSPLVFCQIKSFVAQGLPAAEIAVRVGCTLGSLRVKCSQMGISLRLASPARSESQVQRRLTIPLPESVALDFQKEAEKKGMSQGTLAIALLGAIVLDDLYDAVIDRDVEIMKPNASPVSRRSNTGSM